jgi:hypothetical protein
MLIKPYVDLTDCPETYSGGPSLTISGVPSDLHLSIDQGPHYAAQLETSGDSFVFNLTGQGANGLIRLVSCALIAIMPDSGVEEAFKSLKDIFEFTIEDIESQRLVTSRSSRRIGGQVASSSMRPDLVLTE